MREPSIDEVMAMCLSINAIDDRLGHCSDHEGDENGPTFYMWSLGKEEFMAHAKTLFSLHSSAAYRWKKAMKLNGRRS